MTDDEAIEMLLKVLDHFNWSIAAPVTEDDDTLPGMIIGSEKYIDGLLEGREDQYNRK